MDGNVNNNANNNGSGKGFSLGIIIGVLVSVIIVLILVIGVGVGYTVYTKSKSLINPQPQITSAFLQSKLVDASDLTTAELSYNGIIHYDNGGIPWITQKKYSMLYSATVEAGIDLSGVEIEVTDDTVKVKLPEVQVSEPDVDVDSVEFYDDSFALLNWESKEDAIDAIKEAKKDCKEKADLDGLEAKAYENAKKLVEELLKDLIGDRELIIE